MQKDFADQLENEISPCAKVIRDKTTLEPWDNLTDFMKRIRSEDFAVLLISDEYLKSTNCMYEVSQLMKDDDWHSKVFFVVFDNAKKIYNISTRGDYLTYWDDKCREMESKIKQPFESRVGEVEELQKIKDILIQIGIFLKKISDSKNPKPDEAIKEILKRLKRYKDPDGGQPLNNLPQKNLYFTGREDQLEGVQKAFDEAVHVRRVISGLGGVGKTQTVLEYAHRHLDEYDDGVWWLNAESELELMNCCREILIKVGAIDKANVDDLKPVELLNRWQSWLGEHRQRLLIFDNVERGLFVERYMSKEYFGRVLLTTRDANWGGEPTLSLPLMLESDAREFLLKRTGRKDRCDAWGGVDGVAERLGYLPLALEQAAAYMRNAGLSFSDYLARLSKYGLMPLKKDYAKPDEVYYKKVVATTWQVSFDSIEKNELVHKLFSVCAYANSDNIPLDVFMNHRSVMPDVLSGLLLDDLNVDEAVVLLRQFSLIERDVADSYLISIHRLVQEVVRDALREKSDTSYLDCCFKVLDGAVPKEYGSERASRILFERVAKHAETSTGYYENTHSDNIDKRLDAAKTYGCIGYGYSEMAHFSAALELYKKSLSIYEKVLGKDRPDTATTYNSLAGAYHGQGNYAEALVWFEKALTIREKVLGKNHPDTATTYDNLAGAYYGQGNYAEALVWFEKALTIREKVLGKDHHDAATTYHHIANICRKQGNYVKALEGYERARTIRETALGKNHPDTATTYDCIGLFYYEQGDYAKALEWYERTLSIREAVLGKNHPDTATTYYNIANVSYGQGDYGKALELAEQALTVHEKALGKSHPATISVYKSISEWKT